MNSSRRLKRKVILNDKPKKSAWKKFEVPDQEVFRDMEGFLSLETLDDAEIIKAAEKSNDDESTESPKEEHLSKRPKKRRKVISVRPTSTTLKKDESLQITPIETEIPSISFDDYLEWERFGFADPLIKSIQSLNFKRPTPIQIETLNYALEHRKDIIASAETGSGKTLAFGLPILQGILNSKSRNGQAMMALIIAPTRELALQIVQELKRVSVHTTIKTVALVGGLARIKQDRLLRVNPEIIVATPGRFFEMLDEGNGYVTNFSDLRYFVLDEADRMIENGHFKELDFIISKLPTKEILKTNSSFKRRQTFVFSATMLLDEKLGKWTSKSKKESDLESLMKRIEFHDDKPKIIDLSPKGILATGITEFKIRCTNETKELYLYYFLRLYPGKSIVFVNSIDQIRRLAPLLRLLGLEVQILHSELKQLQRLQNLERFRDHAMGILLASDVAARGLHIPHVQHVIHFQLPRTTETYIHRSGRTGRISESGTSLLLIGPQEVTIYRKLCRSLKKETVADFPINFIYIKKLEKIIKLAQQIDKYEHQIQKQTYNQGWLKKMAKEMDVEIDDTILPNRLGNEQDEDEVASSKSTHSSLKRTMSRWRIELKDLLNSSKLNPTVLGLPPSASQLEINR